MNPNNSQQISDELKQKIIDALTKAGADRPCPRCGNNQFFVADGLVFHILQNSISNPRLGGTGIVCAVVICSKCGYISEHSLSSLGLINEVK